MKILLFLALLLVLMVAHDAFQIRGLIQMSKKLQTLAPFERIGKTNGKKILVIGDSTAVGTGSSSNIDSTAGRLGVLYPDATINNLGINGQKIHQLATDLDPEKIGAFDIILIQIGANDITHFTSLNDVKTDLSTLLKKSCTISKNVVVLHSGRVGNAPLFPWYAKWAFNLRTKQVRNIYQQIVPDTCASYVDLYADGTDDVFASDQSKYYAADGFHPSSNGYAVWFTHIQEALNSHA